MKRKIRPNRDENGEYTNMPRQRPPWFRRPVYGSIPRWGWLSGGVRKVRVQDDEEPHKPSLGLFVTGKYPYESSIVRFMAVTFGLILLISGMWLVIGLGGVSGPESVYAIPLSCVPLLGFLMVFNAKNRGKWRPDDEENEEA